MKTMRALRWQLPALVLAIVTGYAWGQGQQPGQGSLPAVTSSLTKVQATVKEIDPVHRTVALEGPRGELTVAVSPRVRNFSNLKVGDVVNVSYYRSIAAQIAKGSQRVRDPAASTFAYGNSPGMKPAGGAGASVTSTVKIEAIDLGTNTVAFKGHDGHTRIVEVKSPNMQEFIRTLKPGDHVNVTYTESVAVEVIPAS